MEEIILENGKYRFFKGDPPHEYELYCHRYGEKWRYFSGDHAISALFDFAYKLLKKKDR